MLKLHVALQTHITGVLNSRLRRHNVSNGLLVGLIALAIIALVVTMGRRGHLHPGQHPAAEQPDLIRDQATVSVHRDGG